MSRYGFNPRARDGREALSGFLPLACLSFNPRARDGRESNQFVRDASWVVSIHAPVMDAKYYKPLVQADMVFQSTRP